MEIFKGKVAVVGIGEVPTGKFPEKECLDHALASCREAIFDAGINKDEIDMIIPTGTFFNRRYNTDMIFSKLVEELGLLGKAKGNIQVFAGGSSSSAMLQTACGLISSGLAKVILCVQSDKTGSAPVQEMIDLFATFGIPEEWETPFGFFMGGCGGLVATRFMHETGTTHEQIASVVVSMRKWAVLNGNAMLRRELTVEEILNAKPVASNLTAREGNVLADGGASFIVFYPKLYCPFCLSKDLTWTQASGKGRIYTYMVVYGYQPTEFEEDVPYVVAIIDLEEGVRMMSNIVDCDPEDVRCDDPVEVVFDRVTEDFTLPKFRLIEP